MWVQFSSKGVLYLPAFWQFYSDIYSHKKWQALALLNYFANYCFIEAIIDGISVTVFLLKVLETKFFVGITCPFVGIEPT